MRARAWSTLTLCVARRVSVEGGLGFIFGDMVSLYVTPGRLPAGGGASPLNPMKQPTEGVLAMGTRLWDGRKDVGTSTCTIVAS